MMCGWHVIRITITGYFREFGFMCSVIAVLLFPNTLLWWIVLWSMSLFTCPFVCKISQISVQLDSDQGGTAAAAPPPSCLATLPSVGAVP